MQRPLIFLSAVSLELGSARRLAAATLHQLGYDTVSQDNFPTGHGELLQWLREQISRCDGLLQLVGDAYGAEPPEVDPAYGRVSYTQFELLFARRQGKKTWIVEARPGYPCDRAPDQLDRPRDPHHPDPDGYQAERRGLQLAYRQRLRAENQLRHAANSELKLQLILKDLKDDLAEVRDRAERSWRRLNVAMVGILGVLLLLGGGGWWAYQRLHREVVTSGQVDASRIRAHLVEAADRARARELAEADALPGWEERQRRREGAEAAHQARLGRMDELTTFLAQLEGRADASDISRELNRILAGEGVDQALAFLDQQRPGILERARTRLAATRERNRGDLEPLLTAARLEYQRGEVVRAREQFTQVLELEPEWPAALVSFAWFLYEQAIQQERHGSLTVAVSDATQMLSLAEKLPSAQQPSNHNAARVLPAALHKLADLLVLRGHSGDAEQAFDHYERSLKICEWLLATNPDSVEAARDVSVGLTKLANLLSNRRQPGDAAQALAYVKRDLEICERLLTANPDSAQATRDVSVSLELLANLLSNRGQPGDAEQALAHCQRSLEIRDRLLAANPDSALAARDVTSSLELLANLLSNRGQPGDAEQALTHRQRSLEIRDRLLAANPDSVEAARDVSASLQKFADFLSNRGQPGDAAQALGHYERSLEINKRQLQANPDSARAARDVSVLLDRLANLLSRRGQPGDTERALAHCQCSLEISERLLTANPDSAEAARDVAASLNQMAAFLARRGQPGDADQALANCQRSLEIRERLLTANPDSAQAAREMWSSLDSLTDFLFTRDQPGDAEQAFRYSQRSLEISERLHQSSPDSAQVERDVTVSLDRLADFLGGRGQPGDVEQAFDYYRRSLEIRERLLQANPGSAQAERDVSVGLFKLANLLSRRGQPGDAEQAFGHYERSLEINNRRLQANPESAQAEREVAVSLDGLADFLAGRGQPGDAEQAFEYYQRSLEIRQRLLQANLDSAEAARDVYVAHLSFARFHRQRGDTQAATASLVECFTILEDFAEKGRPMDAQMRMLYSQLQPLFKKP